MYLFESFCLVAQTKSISKAARKLHASQPTIGAQIKTLEEKYGTTLFHRSNQGVELTDHGKILYKYAKELLALHAKLEDDIRLAIAKRDLSILIGADTTVGNYILPFLLFDFERENSPLKCEFQILKHDDIYKKVANKEMDIGIIDGPYLCSDLPDYVKCGEIINDDVYLVSTEKILNQKKSLDINSLKKIPFILPSKDLKIRQVIEQNLKEKFNLDLNDLNIVSELNTIAAIKSYVSAGFGASFFSNLAIHRDMETNHLQKVPVDGLSMHMVYYYIYHEDCETADVKKLVSFLQRKVN